MAAQASMNDGYACTVTQDWSPSQTNPMPPGVTPPIAVKKGELVWGFKANSGFVYIKMYRDGAKRGWIPTAVVVKGAKARNPLPVHLPTPPAPIPTNPAAATPSADCLQETLRNLWDTIYNNQTAIEEGIAGMSEYAQDILFSQYSPAYADMIYDNMVPAVRFAMAHGTFGPQQLAQLPEMTGSWPKCAGIYLRLYGGFPTRSFGTRQYNDAVYIGQTTNFQARDAAHESRTDSTGKSNHYRLARVANDVHMIPLVLEPITGAPSHFRDVAELSMVCLLKAWYPVLYTPSDINMVGSYGIDFDACGTFSRLFNGVATTTGWAPTECLGLNWSTPVIRSGMHTQKILSWYDKEKGMYLYRTRRRVDVSVGIVAFNWHYSSRIAISDEIQQDAQFTNGQHVHVTVELMHSGRHDDGPDAWKPHPFRYVRFPTIGRNPELEKLKSMAIKLEWVDQGGTWRGCYLERSKLWNKLKAPSQDILAIYRKGMLVLSTITQVTYFGAPEWVPVKGDATVHFLEYDHHNQRRIVRALPATNKPWPADWTLAQNTSRLRQRFPPQQFTGVVIGAQPDLQTFFAGQKGKRSSCDICLSQRTTTKCRYNPQTHSCQCCIMLNRPCTWTKGQDVIDDFVHGRRLEELGIPVNLTRTCGSQVMQLQGMRFDAQFDSEEHTVLVAGGAADDDG